MASPSSDAQNYVQSNVMTTATSSFAAGANILSEKVSRALEVRTDTPAMKAALEALANLHGSSEDAGNTAASAPVDARSVRVAIEQDALHQAILLQEELRSLVKSVGMMRQSISDISALSVKVNDSVQQNVVTYKDTEPFSKLGGGDQIYPVNASLDADDAVVTDAASNDLADSEESALDKEQQLAAMLSDAFRERNDAQRRSNAVHEFLEKFDLSEHDSFLLDNFDDFGSASDQEGMAFLDALERVRKIRTELSKTFGPTEWRNTAMGEISKAQSSSSYAKLGATSAIRMMEHLACKQERAYERLYHWLQSHLQLHATTHVPTSSTHGSMRSANAGQQPAVDMDSMDEALAHPFVRRALTTLRHVPAFYSHTLELIAASRRTEETRRFLLALTSGYNGLPPIEVKAHDPINYVGDMLAFVYRSMSVEADLAMGLVEVSSSGEDEESSAEPLIVDQPMSAVDLLAHAISGVSRPLKSRIMQVVTSLARRPEEEEDEEEDGSVAQTRITCLYSICGLLLFYQSVINKTVVKVSKHSSTEHTVSATSSSNDTANPLVEAILECLDEATDAYAASVKVYAAMLATFSSISHETEATLTNQIIVSIIDVRKSSPGFSDIECPERNAARLSLAFICEALLTAVSCHSLDDAVTLKETVEIASSQSKAGAGCLSVEFSQRMDQQISQQESMMVEKLVQEEAREVLDVCGLGPLQTNLQRMNDVYVEGMTMASHPGLSPQDVSIAMKEFYSSLYSPPIPSLEGFVKDPATRKHARSRIAERVVETYKELYDAILGERGGYEDIHTVMSHTPSQVRTLFST